jgi:hypothetical protein
MISEIRPSREISRRDAIERVQTKKLEIAINDIEGE